MSGALLRSGSLHEFQALGAVGNPVYSAASQLRAAMRRQFGPEVANLFAVPRQNEHGDSIDWYAPADGDVIPWSAASPEERAQAKAALLQAREQLAARSRDLQSAEDRERQVFGKLLEQATQIPSDEHVYLVDGRPVLTFWGFSGHGARPGLDVLGQLDPGTAPVPEPAPEPEVEPGRPWRWWLWLIPLLLLLLALLWLALRACSPEGAREETLSSAPPTDAAKPARSPGAPTEAIEAAPTEPPIQRSDVLVRERSRLLVDSGSETVVTGPQGTDAALVEEITAEAADALDTAGTPGIEPVAPGVAPEDAASTTLEPPAAPEAPPADPPAEAADAPAEPPPEPSESATQADVPPPEEAPAETQPQETPSEIQPPPFPEAPAVTPPDAAPFPDPAADANPLTIPPEAVQSGSTDFLQGEWRSVTGLQDSQGNPVQLQYDFKDGEGTATLVRGSGTREQRCTGAVRPVMREGKLVIEETGSVTCPDGTVFRRSNVECTVGEGDRAECRGINADGTAYNVNISGK
jgi:hypothetical protein